MIRDDDVRHVAELARLELDEQEFERYAGQLSTILEHIDKISELDLSQVEPLLHVLDLESVMREDEPTPSLSREDALANGPEVQDGAFRVPPIVRE